MLNLIYDAITTIPFSVLQNGVIVAASLKSLLHRDLKNCFSMKGLSTGKEFINAVEVYITKYRREKNRLDQTDQKEEYKQRIAWYVKNVPNKSDYHLEKNTGYAKKISKFTN